MKKILSILIAIIMILPFSLTAFAYDETTFAYKENTMLKFNENGKFKICVVSDAQDGYPGEEAWTTYMNEMLDDVKPDIVIFLGDNIYGGSSGTVATDENGKALKYEKTGINRYAIFDQLLNPVVERNIPFTFVYGNHDDESLADGLGVDVRYASTKELQLKIYQEYPGCLAYDADPDMHGCATHNLPILSSDGSKVAFNLWMFDSGDYVRSEDGSHKKNGVTYYDCVRKDQLEWYKTVSEKLEKENGGLVPSIAFQHIITEEAMKSVFIGSKRSLGETLTYKFSDGTYSTIFPKLSNLNGVILERSCASLDNDGEWDAFVERGDVLAVATGHDHVNDFVTTVNGIDALQITACQYHSEYNRNYLRGAKIITIDENNPWEYEAHTAYSFDYALKDGSKLIGQSGKTKLTYVFAKIMNRFMLCLTKVLRAVFGFFNRVITWVANIFKPHQK